MADCSPIPKSREVLEAYPWVRTQGCVRNLQRRRINGTHIDGMQLTSNNTDLGTRKEVMAKETSNMAGTTPEGYHWCSSGPVPRRGKEVEKRGLPLLQNSNNRMGTPDIWKIRCERRIQRTDMEGRTHSDAEITRR